jgi:hypothetical protein
MTTNHKTFSTFFSMLALMAIFSTHAYASEVTGNLSSSSIQGIDGENNSGSEVGGTLGNGIILAGNVSSGSSNSGSSGGRNASGNEGFVLGASTLQIEPRSNLSYDGTSLTPMIGMIALGTETRNEDMLAVENVEAASSFPTSAIVEETSGTNWFFIILLLLILVTAGIYLYSRNDKKQKLIKSS